MAKMETFHVLAWALVLSVSNVLAAQWEPTNGPGGGDVKTVYAAGGYLFAGTSDRGAFRSTDTAANWASVNSSLPGPCILSFAAIGCKLIAANPDSGLYVSSDNGTSWARFYQGHVTTLNAVGSQVWVGTNTSGVIIIADSTMTLKSVNAGLPNPYPAIVDIAVLGSKVFAGTSNGLYSCTLADNPVTWVADPITDWIGAVESNGRSLFVVAGVINFYTVDTGKTWDSFLTSSYVSALSASGTDIFASGEVLALSTTSGATWTTLDSAVQVGIYSIAKIGQTLVAATEHGVNISTTYGSTWAAANKGMAIKPVYTLLPFGSYLLAGTNIGLFRSGDYGANWIPVATGLYYSDPIWSSLAFNGVLIGSRDGIMRSTDSGATWTLADQGTQAYSIFACGTAIIEGTNSGIMASHNNGTNWIYASNIPWNATIYCFAMGGSTLFAGTAAGVYRSADTGYSWSPVGKNVPVYSLAVLGSKVFAGTRPGSGAILLSGDNGATWDSSNSGISGRYVYSFDTTENVLYAGTDHGVYATPNLGASWSPDTAGLPSSTQVNTLGMKGSYLFAGTQKDGVWRLPLQPTAAGRQEVVKVDKASLKVTSTNRIDSKLIMEFSLPDPARVVLEVYDLSGSRLVTIVNDYCTPGLRRIVWNRQQAASGCLVVRLKAGNEVLVQRVGVVR